MTSSSDGKSDDKLKRKRHRSIDGEQNQPLLKLARSTSYDERRTLTDTLNICISSASSLQIGAPGDTHRVETWNCRNDQVLGAQQYTRL